EGFTVEASQETLSTTIIKHYKKDRPVNLERALLPTARLGGHFVTGHVDCIGKVIQAVPVGDSREVTVCYPDRFRQFLVSKGSVAIDGISLTVNEIGGDTFTTNLIPHTRLVTTGNRWERGVEVNLEFDIIGKHIVRFLEIKPGHGLTLEKLIESGW
ncbi:MAG: riboflavin synthase, partial [Candidatus Zixiibacteriota bacterium]